MLPPPSQVVYSHSSHSQERSKYTPVLTTHQAGTVLCAAELVLMLTILIADQASLEALQCIL